MKKHVAVLERAGLIEAAKIARVRTCRLGRRTLEAEGEWIEAQRRLFEARFVRHNAPIPSALLIASSLLCQTRQRGGR